MAVGDTNMGRAQLTQPQAEVGRTSGDDPSQSPAQAGSAAAHGPASAHWPLTISTLQHLWATVLRLCVDRR